jgi:DNA-binding MarR family transcriptional regulator
MPRRPATPTRARAAAEPAARRRPGASGAGGRGGDGIDRGLLSGLLGFHVRQAQIAVFRDFAATMGPLDMTPGLFAVLVLVEANPGLKQSQLARAVHLDRSSVVSVVDKLERRGLLERHTAAHDRRSNALRLTSTGAALLRRLKQRVARHERRLASGLDAGERATLVALLGRVFPEHR